MDHCTSACGAWWVGHWVALVSNWQGGSTRAWRRTRAFVLARDGWQCRVRIKGVCTYVATCVHHVHGRGVTGDDPRHLVAACAECNAHVGDPTKNTGDPSPSPATKW